MQFTASCIENKDPSVIAFPTDVQLQGISWCRDWRFNIDGAFETSSLSALHHFASGTQPPIYTADLEGRLLPLQGYKAGTIVHIDDFQQEIRSEIDWNLILRVWEHAAGVEGSAMQQAFGWTTIADCWSVGLLNWKQRIIRGSEDEQNKEDEAYKEVVRNACINRRFFVTDDGKCSFRLCYLKKDDMICILFGGKTPFVIRRCPARRKTRALHGAREEKAGRHYKIIGEAFVDGLMYYDGSMEDDLGTGNVLPEWIHRVAAVKTTPSSLISTPPPPHPTAYFVEGLNADYAQKRAMLS